jgi:Fe-S-cluster containining protein
MVAAEIDCKQCAWCCEVCYPLLKESDITRFAKGLKMPVAEFKTNFLKPVENESEKLTFKELPCPFLKNNLCTNYKFRPTDCRSFPHLHKKGFISRTVSVIENSAICPIVYNVYELLKEELWHRSGDFEDEDF